MTKKILLLLLTITLIVGAFGAFAIVASAETVMPEMSIAYCNISFRDNICIKYAVSSNVSDVKILIWTSPEIEYTVGTHDGEITEYYTEKINGVAHMIFDYTELSAKQMTDVVYARAYAKVDGVDYYSEINKYSILQYAYNKLGKTATASTDTEFKEMLTNMLAYGASAQKYFDYKEDRLASADWYQVKVTEGALADGSMSGLYLPGDKVTLTAPEADAQGHVFSFWVDSNGNEIATTATYELTVGTANEIYTPAYEHTVVIDAAVAPTCNVTGLTEGSHCSVCGEVFVEQEILAATGEHTFGEWETVKDATTTEEGLMERFCACGAKETQTIEKIVPELAYTLNDNGKSYSVTGIGTWTDSVVVIPDTYNGLPVTVIGYDAFDSKPITNVVIPNSVTLIKTDAFRKCELLTSVTLGNGIKTIEFSAFEYCTSLTSISLPNSVTTIGGYAFNGCTSLSSLTLSNSISSMSYNAFSNCTSLVEVIIPSGVSIIGDSAFKQCSNLKYVSIPESVKKVGYDAFYGCPRSLAIHIKGSSSITSGWDSSWNKSYDYQSYFTYSYTPLCALNEVGKTADRLYWMETYLSSQDWSGDVIEIVGYAGNDAKLVIPETINGKPVKMIRENAFRSNTDILSITLPANLDYINQYAFYGCNNLMEVINKSDLTITAGSTNNGYVGYYAKLIHSGNSMVSELNGYVFFEEGDTVYLMKYNGTDIDLVLPADYNGRTYKIYKSAFENNTNIKSVIIPNGVTSIGEDAFNGCSNLASITIGNGVTSIGSYALEGCSSLTDIIIPDSVKSIGSRAFYNCTSLTNITIGSGLANFDNGYFNGCSNIESINVSNENAKYYSIQNCLIEKDTNKLVMGCKNSVIPYSVTNIGSNAFYKCTSLKSIMIPESVTSIGSNAFDGCTLLKTVYYETDLTSWIKISFSNSSSNPCCNGAELYLDGELLTTAEIPTGISSIGFAFCGCTSLTSVAIPEGVTSINDSAFKNCNKLSSVTLPNSVTSIGSYAFYNCESLKSITIPDNVTSIGSYAFGYCDLLESVTIPNSVTTIGTYAFTYCKSLKNVTLPNSVTSIGSYAFINCTALKSIAIPTGVTRIDDNTFENCSSLVYVTLHDNITHIDYAAFRNCGALVSITIPKSVTNIGSYAFEKCYKLVEVINKSSLSFSAGTSNYGCVAYYAKTVNSDTSKIVNVNDYLFYTYNNVNYLLGYTGTDTELTLPENYNGKSYKIYSYAFYNCSNLTSIIIPENVVAIGRWAFNGCVELTSIMFEDTSTWYQTYNDSTYGGTSVSVTDPSTNVALFKSTYVNNYWYKK